MTQSPSTIDDSATVAAEPSRLQLGHGSQPGHVLTGDQRFRRTIDQRAQQFDFGLHFRELEVDRLVVEDALAECLAAPCIFDRVGNDGFMRLEAGRRAPQPLLLELHHLVGEAVAFLANTISLRHPHLVEENLRGIG